MQTLSNQEMLDTNGGSVLGVIYVVGAAAIVYKMVTAKTFRINLGGLSASWSN